MKRKPTRIRTRTANTGGSEIWLRRRTSGNYEAVRLDAHGHYGPAWFAGTRPHVHKELIPRDKIKEYRNHYVPGTVDFNDDNELVSKPVRKSFDDMNDDEKALMDDWAQQLHTPIAKRDLVEFFGRGKLEAASATAEGPPTLPRIVSVNPVVAVTDDDERRNLLNSLIVEVREENMKLDENSVGVLYDCLEHAGNDLEYWVVWTLLSFSPYEQPDLKELSFELLGDSRSLCRGQALLYLMRSHPDQVETLYSEYNGDQDPYVQDAIAIYYADLDSELAARHWLRVLSSNDISHELAESTPYNIAALGDARLIRELKEKDREAGSDTLWSRTRDLLLQHIESEQEEQG